MTLLSASKKKSRAWYRTKNASLNGYIQKAGCLLNVDRQVSSGHTALFIRHFTAMDAPRCGVVSLTEDSQQKVML